jgi:hypothetical protein
MFVPGMNVDVTAVCCVMMPKVGKMRGQKVTQRDNFRESWCPEPHWRPWRLENEWVMTTADSLNEEHF